MTETLVLDDGNDDGGVSLSEWRGVLAAQKEFERAWHAGERPEVQAYAAKFAEVSSGVLIPELERLSGELQSADFAVTAPCLAGRYVDLQLLNVGGMGEVFSALDVECGRRVALKKIRQEYAEDREVRQRFLLEGELTASLEHPGVIPIYGRGVDSDSRDFYVMRLIAGSGTGTLRQSILQFHDALSGGFDSECQSRFRGLVQRVLDVAGTAAYAHAQGIVHRDLKPANVLIGPQGETLIGDWGLARRVDGVQVVLNDIERDFRGGEESRRGSGAVAASSVNSGETCAAGLDSSIRPATTGVGTPGFAAPEQLRLQTTTADVKLADIYSVGAILVCVLTGKPPLNGWQPIPRTLSSAVGIASLSAIAERAMQSDPAGRYGSMSELCADLERWLAGEPVSAYREGFIERLWRWPGRHRLLSSALASGVLISLVGAGIFLVVQSRQKSELESRSVALGKALQESADLLVKNRHAREAAERLQRVAEEARVAAEQARAAEAEGRRQAQAREELAFQAFRQFQEVIVANPALRFQTEFSPLREELMQRSRSFLESLLEQFDHVSELSGESLHRLVITADGATRLENELGHQGEAYRVSERASALLRTLLRHARSEGRPTELLSLYLGRLLTLQGSLGMQYGWREQAGVVLQESIDTLEPLLKYTGFTQQQQQDLRVALSRSASSLAVQVNAAGKSELAKSLISRALQAVGSEVPRTIDDAMLILQGCGNLSLILETEGDLAGAIVEVQKAEAALRVAESLVTSETSLRMQMDLRATRSKIMHDQISLLQKQGATARVLRLLQEQLPYDTAGLQKFPAVHDMHTAYGRTVMKLVETQLKVGQQDEARQSVATWLSLAKELQPRGGVTEQSLVFLMGAQHGNGHVHEALGDPERACADYVSAVNTAQQASLAGYRNASLLLQLVELHSHLAALGLRGGEQVEVEVQIQSAVSAAAEMVENPSGGSSSAGEQAVLRRLLLGTLQRLRQAGQAESAERWEREMRERNLLR
jgi:serine/threonine protein kinase